MAFARPRVSLARAIVPLLCAIAGLAHSQDPRKDGEWPMAARDYANTRYSPLADITPANAAQLKPVITFSTGVLRGHEAAPLVVGNTMFLVTPYPNYVYALDLTKPGAPTKWKFEPRPNASSQGVACCDVVNRGMAFDNGRVYFNTLDNQTIALDAGSGKELWRTSLGDINKGETITTTRPGPCPCPAGRTA